MLLRVYCRGFSVPGHEENRLRRGFRNKGFTLLELLISMTILAMIVVIVFGAFRVGVRAWEKGENAVEGRQRQRIVLDLIRHQLASVCATPVLDREGKPIRFRGDRRSMTFVSLVQLTPGAPAGPTYVRYAVRHDATDDTAGLAFYERGTDLPDGMAGAGDPDEADFYQLLDGLGDIAFEYLKIRPDATESPWQESWDPAFDKGVPRAVRIMVRENSRKAPIYVIAAAGK
jgi:general secretion pathway protein J